MERGNGYICGTEIVIHSPYSVVGFATWAAGIHARSISATPPKINHTTIDPKQLKDNMGDKLLGWETSPGRWTQHPRPAGRQDERQERRQEKDKISEADTAFQIRRTQ